LYLITYEFCLIYLDQFRPPPFTGDHFAGAPLGHFPGQFPGTIPGYWGAGGHIPGAGGSIPGHPMTEFPGGPDWEQSDYQNPVSYSPKIIIFKKIYM
jgi:hypothetical protein